MGYELRTRALESEYSLENRREKIANDTPTRDAISELDFEPLFLFYQMVREKLKGFLAAA